MVEAKNGSHSEVNVKGLNMCFTLITFYIASKHVFTLIAYRSSS